jgi:hypothetical protein
MLAAHGMEDAEFGDPVFESGQLQPSLTELFTHLERPQLGLSLSHAHLCVLDAVMKGAIPLDLGLKPPVPSLLYFVTKGVKVGARPL